MTNKIELFKRYAKNVNSDVKISFELTRSKRLYMIMEFGFGFKAYDIDDNGFVDQIGSLNYKIEKKEMFISYLHSSLSRGEGVGTALLRRAKKVANENGCKEICLNSLKQAEPFYEKLGFKNNGEVYGTLGLKRYTFNLKNNFYER